VAAHAYHIKAPAGLLPRDGLDARVLVSEGPGARRRDRPTLVPILESAIAFVQRIPADKSRGDERRDRMAVQVNGVGDLAPWAKSKSCGPWKADRSCGHPGCAQDQRAVDILSALTESSPGVWTLDEADIHLTA
jgi:hypothetical protein